MTFSIFKRGFTLIELLVVVVIIATLAAVGVSTYRSMVLDARSSEGAAALSTLKAKQELFRSRNFRYAADIADLPGYSSATGGTYNHNEYYQLTIRAADADTFTAAAADTRKPIGGGTSGQDVWVINESLDDPCHTSKGWSEDADPCADGL